MKIENYLKYKNLETQSEEILAFANAIALKFSDRNLKENYISEILDLFHSAITINQIDFIRDIFFEFYLNREKTNQNKSRIYYELASLSEYIPNSKEEANHLVNIYRNLISDLFDPYISIIVASHQFKEGNFTTFLNSNLGQGERNKYEYCLARMSNTSLFDGYNPLVRNAISHTGTDSIRYSETEIIFKNIKRGQSPIVTTEKWTHEELKQKITDLLNFINSIDFTIEIFGYDISDIIKTTESLNFKFLDEILDFEQRLELQDKFDQTIKKISASEKLNLEERLDALTTSFFLECRKRALEVTNNRFNTKQKAVLVEIPLAEYDDSKNEELVSRFLRMLRIGIVAEPCYRNWGKKIMIVESNENKEEYCKILGDFTQFREYNFEKAGIVDLANDLEFYYKKNKVEIIVDFNKVQEWDDNNLGRIFPRKKRE
jgi:hypothetical protein